jgi:hypothetical protein
VSRRERIGKQLLVEPGTDADLARLDEPGKQWKFSARRKLEAEP